MPPVFRFLSSCAVVRFVLFTTAPVWADDDRAYKVSFLALADHLVDGQPDLVAAHSTRDRRPDHSSLLCDALPTAALFSLFHHHRKPHAPLS